LWRAVIGLIRANPDLRFDMIDLDRMPERIGSQRNPFLDLAVLPRTYGAHFATLGLDWNEFFLSKRSSATRKRERRQFKHLAEHGEIRFVQVTRSDEIERSMNLLIEQKRRFFPACRSRTSSTGPAISPSSTTSRPIRD
jgi:CelD/BcsL family acetyltransferase involved in cellulose biosynthesis